MTQNSRSREWNAERQAGEVLALLNDISDTRAQIKQLAFHQAGYKEIYQLTQKQDKAVQKLLTFYKEATADIFAVIGKE